MLKKYWLKKMIISLSTVFALLLLCLIPNKNKRVLKNVKQEREYTSKIENKREIYLLDPHGYIGRTYSMINSQDPIDKAREILNTLIIGSSSESKVPNGFRGIIPSDTKINSIEFKDGILVVDFSKDLLDVKKEMEEKVIEALIYNLTSIDGVEKIMLLIDNQPLNKLPQTGIIISKYLDRSFGINKIYDINNTKDINQVTIYYISKYNGNEYYVPVTKYVNDDRKKMQIIVDELTSSNVYNSNLMSYLNSNTKLLAISEDVDKLELVFNSYILDNITDKNILEGVIYTIALSARDNYDSHELVFKVDNEEIYKTVMKTIE